MKKRNLVSLMIGIPLATSLLIGCTNNYDSSKAKSSRASLEEFAGINEKTLKILKSYKGLDDKREVKKGDNYLKYAKELQKYPKLKEENADIIAKFLREINENKELIAGPSGNYVSIPFY
jgi:hypothetical protein